MSITIPGTGATFDVDWEKPGDEQMFWQQDRMHYPNQMSMMEDDCVRSLLRKRFRRCG